MEQHAVPQNISNYEFRLVGDMTLKQFFQLAGGAGVALIFFKSPLPFFIKWPAIGLALLTGVALAFLPVSGRPFSQWLLAFIRAIYTPTFFAWNASTSPFPITSPDAGGETRGRSIKSPLDLLEDQLLGKFGKIFQTDPDKIKQIPVVAVHEMHAPTPPPPLAPTAPIAQTDYAVLTGVKPPAPAVEPGPTPAATETVTVTPPPEPVKIAELTPIITHQTIAAKPATAIATTVPMPIQSNLIVGQVVGLDQKPVEGAIVEVIDNMTNMPVRALRTNKLGQFQMATRLFAGDYTVITEKAGLTFQPLLVKAKDEIVSPILISAQTT